jgi:hypothetical protein
MHQCIGYKRWSSTEIVHVIYARALRDKWIAHGESGFAANDAPSYDHMERLFNFGLDFYVLVSRAIVLVGPSDLNGDRRVKASLKRMLQKLGCDAIRTDME